MALLCNCKASRYEPSLLGSPGHRFGSPRCAAPRGRLSTVLAPAGKQYDVCLFPERAEQKLLASTGASTHVPLGRDELEGIEVVSGRSV